MSQQDLDSKQLLTAFANALHKAFIESSRDEAKGYFKTLSKGDAIPLLQLNFEDGEYLKSDLVLNHSEFRGNLNYSAFIQSLAALLHEVVNLVEDEKDIATLTSEDGLETLFKITGLSEKDGEMNVLMMSFRQVSPGVMQTTLMYMNPEQLRKETAEDAVSA